MRRPVSAAQTSKRSRNATSGTSAATLSRRGPAMRSSAWARSGQQGTSSRPGRSFEIRPQGPSAPCRIHTEPVRTAWRTKAALSAWRKRRASSGGSSSGRIGSAPQSRPMRRRSSASRGSTSTNSAGSDRNLVPPAPVARKPQSANMAGSDHSSVTVRALAMVEGVRPSPVSPAAAHSPWAATARASARSMLAFGDGSLSCMARSGRNRRPPPLLARDR
jgi:hypothetical protein